MDYTKGVESDNIDRKPTFDVNPENWLHQAVITEIKVGVTEPKEETDESLPILVINFQSPNGKQEHRQTFREPADDEKGQWLLGKLGHIYNTFMGTKANIEVPQADGSKATLGACKENTFVAFINKVAEDFNTAKNGKPVYLDKDGKRIIVNIKFVRGKGKYSQYLDLPFPNFMELYVAGSKSLIVKHPKDNFRLETAPATPQYNMGTNPTPDTKPNADW